MDGTPYHLGESPIKRKGFHSLLKESTGLLHAAFSAWTLVVSRAMINDETPAITKVIYPIVML
jgi:hypothetical protein